MHRAVVQLLVAKKWGVVGGVEEETWRLQGSWRQPVGAEGLGGGEEEGGLLLTPSRLHFLPPWHFSPLLASNPPSTPLSFSPFGLLCCIPV